MDNYQTEEDRIGFQQAEIEQAASRLKASFMRRFGFQFDPFTKGGAKTALMNAARIVHANRLDPKYWVEAIYQDQLRQGGQPPWVATLINVKEGLELYQKFAIAPEHALDLYSIKDWVDIIRLNEQKMKDFIGQGFPEQYLLRQNFSSLPPWFRIVYPEDADPEVVATYAEEAKGYISNTTNTNLLTALQQCGYDGQRLIQLLY